MLKKGTPAKTVEEFVTSLQDPRDLRLQYEKLKAWNDKFESQAEIATRSLEAVSEKLKIAIRQRDKARREICERNCYVLHSPQEMAKARDWDCYESEEK